MVAQTGQKKGELLCSMHVIHTVAHKKITERDLQLTEELQMKALRFRMK